MGIKAQPTYTQCPWCFVKLHKSQLGDHLRDTGELSVRPVDQCVVLFDMRNGHKEVLGA